MPRAMRASAIDKQPVQGPVRVEVLGLDDDEQAERRFHGGPGKAVYAYASEDLEWWSAQLGRPLAPGFIGENVTLEGVDCGALRPGDELHCGKPRDPCAKLAARVGSADFVKRFGRAGRTGVYCEVLRSGTIAAGNDVTVVRAPTAGPTIRDIVAARYGRDEPEP
jgi:MOSC domain-containing protein YiiM